MLERRKMFIVELIETLTVRVEFDLLRSEDITEVCDQLKKDNVDLGIIQGVEVYLNSILGERT